LHDASSDLALGIPWISYRAAVMGDRVIDNAHNARFEIDGYDRGVANAGIRIGGAAEPVLYHAPGFVVISNISGAGDQFRQGSSALPSRKLTIPPSTRLRSGSFTHSTSAASETAAFFQAFPGVPDRGAADRESSKTASARA
jgi:hypothetical protein